MKGTAGLLENFDYYYLKVMEKADQYPLNVVQRNSLYEQFRMAEAFYLSICREPALSVNDRIVLERKYAVLKERVGRVQQGNGDSDLRAV